MLPPPPALMYLQNKRVQLSTFSAHPYPWHPKKKKKRSQCASPHPRWMVLIFSLVHVWLSVCKEEGGHIITHSAPDRTKCSRPAGARGFVFHPFFRGPAVVWVCRAQWCCCYKYASTSVSKWQLYSGPRTHCLGTVRVSHSKKGKPSVAALVDMYLCTCSSWCVVFRLKL